jgi:protocatechuate 3,4-dioxygenase beta subunit
VLETVQEARTNEMGEYRLFWLLPGRYYLAAVSTSWNGNSEMIIGRGGAPQMAPGTANQQSRTVLGGSAYNAAVSGTPPQPTFFPSVASADSATSVEVLSGGETRDVEIRLLQVGTFHVCGVLSVIGELPPPPAPRGQQQPTPAVQATTVAPNPPRPPDICAEVVGAPIASANVSQIRLATTGTMANVSNAGSDIYTTSVDPTNGRFIFRNVRPGNYELSSTLGGLNGRVNVEVRDGHIENAALTLTRGFDLTVRLLGEEGAAGKAPPLAQLRPYLGDDPPSPREPFLGEFTQDGRTTIKNVPADDYRVYLEPLLNSAVAPSRVIPQALQNVYVKSMLLGPSDALNAPMRFSGQPDVTLDIIIGANPGILEGQVLDGAGAPMRGAIVTLLPNTTSRNRVFRMDMYRAVISDSSGHFKATGIPPGDYKVFAWAGIERDAWMDPELQRAYEERGVSVRVEERSAVSVDLRLIVPGL